MNFKLKLYLLFQHSIYIWAKPKELCKYVIHSENVNADYYITGLFPVYSTATTRGMSNGLQYSEVMKYTLGEFNKKSKFSVGYEFYDTCGEKQLEITMGIITDILLSNREHRYMNEEMEMVENDVICHATTFSAISIFGADRKLDNITSLSTDAIPLSPTKKISSKFNTTCYSSKLTDITTYSTNQITKKSCKCSNETSISKYLIGIVGPASSTVSIRTNQFLSIENLPMISYASTNPTLSIQDKHPGFMRTIPSDTYQVQVIIDLILHFNWTFITVIASDNSYGRAGKEELLRKLKQHDICVGKQLLFGTPYNDEEIENVIKIIKADKQSQIIVLFALTTASKKVFYSSEKLQLYGRTWILTEGVVGIGSWIHDIDSRVIGGSLGVNPFAGDYKEFDDYFYALNDEEDAENNIFLKLYFNTSKQITHENITLQDYRYKFSGAKVGYVRNAVTAYLTALESYVNDMCKQKPCHGNYPPITDRKLFNDIYLKPVKFNGLLGEMVEFDDNGDILKPFYRILNMQNRTGQQTLIHVGNWSNGILFISQSEISWTDNNRLPKGQCSQDCSPGFYAILDVHKKCCWHCMRCSKGFVKTTYGQDERCKLCAQNYVAKEDGTECMIIGQKSFEVNSKYGCIIIALVIIGILSSLVICVTYAKFRHTMYVRTANIHLSYLQVITQMLLFVSFLLMFTERSKLTCSLQLYIIGIVSCIVFSVILIKTELLHRIFRCKHRISIAYRRLTIKLQIIIISSICIIYICLQICITILNKPINIKELYMQEDHYVNITCDYNRHLISTLLYLILISIICGIQAYRTRRLPQVFNEGSYIMYGVFISSLCMILTIFLVLYAKNTPEKLFMINIFIFITNIILLLIMYGYKIWIILFYPDQNNRQSMPVFILQSSSYNSSRRYSSKSNHSPNPLTKSYHDIEITDV